MISSIYFGFGLGAVVCCGFVDREFTRHVERAIHPRLGNPIVYSLLNLAIGWMIFGGWPLFFVSLVVWSWRGRRR